MRTLGGILATDSTADVTRLGWPTLRAGFPLMTVLNAMREMRAALARRAGGETPPVMAVIGAGPDQDRSIAALNIALAAARDGAKVLLIDADLRERALSDKVSHLARSEPSRFGWLGIGAKAARAIPDRQRNFDPAGRQCHRRESRRRHPKGDCAGPFRRRL